MSLAGSLALLGAGSTVSGSADTAATVLYPGWNLIGWTEEQVPVEQAFDGLPNVVSIHDGKGHFAVRDSDLAIDEFESLIPGRGYWFMVESDHPVFWSRPSQPVSRFVKLARGDQLTAWTGRNQTDIAEALEGITDRLTVAWTWDASKQRFAPWASAGPFPDLGIQLNYGDGLLLRITEPGDWLHPSGLLPAIVAPRDLSSELRQSIEAEVLEVERFFAHTFTTPIDQTRITIFVVDLLDHSRVPVPTCCPTPLGWPLKFRDGVGEYRYQIRVPLQSWTSKNWNSSSPGMPGAFGELVHDYFRVLQYELAGNVFESIPRWLILGTTSQIRQEFGHPIDDGHGTEYWTSQLELSLTSEATPLDRWLGNGYVARLVNNSTEESYFNFWRFIDRRNTSEGSWRRAFLQAFGISADDFVAEVNQERLEAFTNLTGRVSREPVVDGSVLRIVALSHLPTHRISYYGDILPDGTYSVTLPRHFPYKLSVKLYARNCQAYVGADGALVSVEEAALLLPSRPSEVGPQVRIPHEFCQEQVAVRFTGLERDLPPELQVEACSVGNGICSHMNGSLGRGYAALVAMPGSFFVRFTSGSTSCPTNESVARLTADRDLSLLVESDMNPTPAPLGVDAYSEFCGIEIQRHLTERPPE